MHVISDDSVFTNDLTANEFYGTEDDWENDWEEDWDNPSQTHKQLMLKELEALHKKTIKHTTKQCMLNFFKKKTFHVGGKIPKKLIITPEKITVVDGLPFVIGVEIFYSFLQQELDKDPSFDLCCHPIRNKENGDVKLLLRLLKDLGKKNIPIEKRGGMILLYLELCEGVIFPYWNHMAKEITNNEKIE